MTARLVNNLQPGSIGAMLLFACTCAQSAPPGESSPVTVTEVVAQSLREEIPLSGTTEALHESSLSPRVEGIVQEVLVTEGDSVEVGQTLLRLDPTFAELDVASAQARVDEAVARHEDAVRRKAEFRSLRKRNAVASTSLDSAVADEQAARATLSRQRAELKRAEEQLSRHSLAAPFAGVVVDKQAEVGQWVKIDSEVVRLVALDRVRVRAAVPQHYYARIDPATAVRVIFDALQGEAFSGRPSALVAVGKESTRSFPLLIELDNPQHRIAPGMSARLFIELSGDLAGSLLVPRDAVVLKADGSRIVWRMNEEDGELKVVPVSVSIGRSRDGLVEILDSTLEAGDRIVLLGNENLRPGQAVQPRPAD